MTAVLLVEPPTGSDHHDDCVADLLAAGASGGHVCRVEFTGTIDPWLARWDEGDAAPPARLVAVNATGVGWASPDSGDPDRVTVAQETAPSNLTQIGTAVTRFLDNAGDAEGRALVCVHSLTTLLQYVDLRDAFRFLHLLTGRLKAVDATAHYHMDPSAHDEREVNTLKSLFDAVVEVDENDEWTVRTRS